MDNMFLLDSINKDSLTEHTITDPLNEEIVIQSVLQAPFRINYLKNQNIELFFPHTCRPDV